MTITEAPNGSYTLFIAPKKPETTSRWEMWGTAVFNIQLNTQDYEPSSKIQLNKQDYKPSSKIQLNKQDYKPSLNIQLTEQDYEPSSNILRNTQDDRPSSKIQHNTQHYTPSSKIQLNPQDNKPSSNIQRNTQHYTSTASTLKFTLTDNVGSLRHVVPFTTDDHVYVTSIAYGSEPLQYIIAFFTLDENNEVDKQLVLGTEIVSPVSWISVMFTAQRSTTQVTLQLKQSELSKKKKSMER